MSARDQVIEPSVRQQVIHNLGKGDFFHILSVYYYFLQDENAIAEFNNYLEKVYDDEPPPVIIITPGLFKASVARVVDELHKAKARIAELEQELKELKPTLLF